jgi:hypothetical protein
LTSSRLRSGSSINPTPGGIAVKLRSVKKVALKIRQDNRIIKVNLKEKLSPPFELIFIHILLRKILSIICSDLGDPSPPSGGSG